jgi:hypothetical protein
MIYNLLGINGAPNTLRHLLSCKVEGISEKNTDELG